jgi:ABC-type phosphate transport system ATPase subunit
LHHGKLAEHSPAKSFFQKPKSAAAKAYLAGKLVL